MRLVSRSARQHGLARWVLLVAGIGLVSVGAQAADQSMNNLGGGLRQMVKAFSEKKATAGTNAAVSDLADLKLLPMAETAAWDASGRVRVGVYLDGKRSMEAVSADLKRLGATVDASTNLLAAGKGGAIQAHIPLNQAAAVGKMAGVKSVMLSRLAHTNVGLVTSEGAAVLHTSIANLNGITGKGITIGVLSDSYDTSTGPIHAANDVSSGDLPGTGNPLGHTNPVVVVQDGPPGATDEGRGMLQIIHDLAPDAKLCFATAFSGEIGFAANILNLADPTKCGANVIVDDVGYSDEAVFSDNLLANAVNTAASTGVAYFSSAGNSNGNDHDEDFNFISDKDVRAGLPGSNLKLDQVPPELTAGGFHNFGTAKSPVIAQSLTTSANDFAVLQWNDPFNVGLVTVNYTLLVFDTNGNFLPDLSGTDNTIATDQPVQAAGLNAPMGPVGYQLVVARSTTAKTRANRFHYTFFRQSTTQNNFKQVAPPATHGHPSAARANGVAADFWFDTKGIESFSSLGPTTIYFDSVGRRLDTPEVREKPDFAAVDGVQTTFFGQLIGTEKFPSFFGTSAAAPHAAAVAGLVLQAAGGPGSVSPNNMKKILKATANSHASTAGFISARASGSTFNVDLGAAGYVSAANQFTLAYNDRDKNAKRSLIQLDIDLSPTSLFTTNLVFLVGTGVGIKPTDVTNGTTAAGTTETIKFTKGVFTSGKVANFGFRFAEAAFKLGGRTANLLSGAKFTATFDDGKKVTGTLLNKLSNVYTPADGTGLINAERAISLFQPQKVKPVDVSASAE